jgi:transcriptional regulator with XRE-family HTH domain
MRAEWFAGRLRELREASGMTQKQLAEASGLKEGGIRDLEQGRRGPSWETVLALAKALSVDCLAFTTPPAAEAAAPRPRGRPRKGSIVEADSLSSDVGRTTPPSLKSRGKSKARERRASK